MTSEFIQAFLFTHVSTSFQNETFVQILFIFNLALYSFGIQIHFLEECNILSYFEHFVMYFFKNESLEPMVLSLVCLCL